MERYRKAERIFEVAWRNFCVTKDHIRNGHKPAIFRHYSERVVGFDLTHACRLRAARRAPDKTCVAALTRDRHERHRIVRYRRRSAPRSAEPVG